MDCPIFHTSSEIGYVVVPIQKEPIGLPGYPIAGQEPQRAVGLSHNRHLNYLEESFNMNVRDYPETEANRSAGETWVESEAP
jgi:hypothetical protein